jgi:hypothetical protein
MQSLMASLPDHGRTSIGFPGSSENEQFVAGLFQTIGGGLGL